MKWDGFIAELKAKGTPYLQLDAEHTFKWSYGSIKYFQDGGWPHHRYADHEEDFVLTGGILNHRLDDGGTCGGFVSFVHPLNPSDLELTHALWTVESLDPLTISPSCLCKGVCHPAEHGFIRNGLWVPA